MLQPIRTLAASLPERLRERFGQRATGIVVALALEALLLLMLLTLGQAGSNDSSEAGPTLTTFDAGAEPEQPQAEQSAEPERQQPEHAEAQPTEASQVPQAAPPPSALPQPAPTRAAPIPLRPDPLAGVDISELPRAPAPPPAARPAYGPPDTGYPGDSKRVGTAPNGEPLYGAEWYREPYESELAGYLSTAQGPGWGLIACRTAPDYRVEDCVALDEAPRGSNMARAVLAAAWQFKVRPPRIGGRPMVGEWVRIRITYQMRRE